MIKETTYLDKNYIFVSIICYGFGILHTVLTYSMLGIPILYYTNLSDILVFAGINIGLIYLVFYLFQNVYIKYLITKYGDLNPWRLQSIVRISIMLPVIVIVIIIGFTFNYLSNKFYFPAVMAIPAAFLIANTAHLRTARNLQKFMYWTLIVMYFSLFVLTMMVRVSFYIKVDKKNVNFIYNEKIVIPKSKSQFYVGENSDYFFYFDTIRKKSNIYKKSNCDNIEY